MHRSCLLLIAVLLVSAACTRGGRGRGRPRDAGGSDGSRLVDSGPRPDGGPRFDGGPRPDGFTDPCATIDCPGDTDCISYTCNSFTAECEESFRPSTTPCSDCFS